MLNRAKGVRVRALCATSVLVAGVFAAPGVRARASSFLAQSGATQNASPANAAQAAKPVAPERLGSVYFPISCAPDAQKTFDTALALLHNFQYNEAEQAFSQVAQQDPTCAMAYWGKAMSLYHQLWDWPSAATLQEGNQDAIQGLNLHAPTDRERMYIVAAAVFFQNNPSLTEAQRIQAYSDWMGRIFKKYKDDVNAGAFYALSLITLQGTKEQQEANREQAIAILDKLMAVAPDNPGVLHYLIHAADTPELAPQGLVAAQRYAKIAPDSAHALHMPSHIFVRLGMWQDAIQSNIASAAAASQATQSGDNEASYQLHAMDFLDYCYLQAGESAKAQNVVTQLTSVPGATPQEIADHQALFQARNALELHQWQNAAGLSLPGAPPSAQDVEYFVRTIGAARNGDAAGAQQDFDNLNQSVAAQKQAQQPQAYAAGSGNTLEQQEALAWLYYAQGKNQDAVKTMLAAAKQEESAGVDSLTMPAREMLGDMLRLMKRPAAALAEYKLALAESPNRFDSLYGAAQAAQLAGNHPEARRYLSQLLKICAPDADRPELQQARIELAKK